MRWVNELHNGDIDNGNSQHRYPPASYPRGIPGEIGKKTNERADKSDKMFDEIFTHNGFSIPENKKPHQRGVYYD